MGLWPITDTECPVMGTNVKINLFFTLPVTSANVNKINIVTIFFRHDEI